MENNYLVFVESTLKSISNHPEDVTIDKETDDMGVILRVRINKEDFPIIIGRNGQVIDAVRTLARVLGAKENARVSIKIEDDPRKQNGEQSA